MVRTTAEVLPIYKAIRVSNARFWDIGFGAGVEKSTYQEDHRHVEQESDEGVRKECEDADAVDVGHAHAGDLNEQGDNAVDDSAGRGVVVEGNKRVHLELGGAQHTLDHNETQSLEDDTAALVYTGNNTDCQRKPRNQKRAREEHHNHIQMKPIRSNLISPKEAITTPRTMIPTFPSTFMFGGAMPKAQVANRVTTALVALSI